MQSIHSLCTHTRTNYSTYTHTHTNHRLSVCIGNKMQYIHSICAKYTLYISTHAHTRTADWECHAYRHVCKNVRRLVWQQECFLSLSNTEYVLYILNFYTRTRTNWRMRILMCVDMRDSKSALSRCRVQNTFYTFHISTHAHARTTDWVPSCVQICVTARALALAVGYRTYSTHSTFLHAHTHELQPECRRVCRHVGSHSLFFTPVYPHVGVDTHTFRVRDKYMISVSRTYHTLTWV